MRRISLVLMFLSLATAQSPSTNSYAEGSDTAAVRRQMLALRSAELQYDVSSAAKLLADGFLLSGADGNLYTKERFLKLVGDKSNPLELFDYSETEIHIYRATAVVFSRLHEKGFMGGKPYELNGRPRGLGSNGDKCGHVLQRRVARAFAEKALS